MPERVNIFEVAQIGLETTAGSTVAANKQLLATRISPSIAYESNPFTPTGYRFATLAPAGKESMTADIEGVLAYNDTAYLLSSAVGSVTPSQIGTIAAYSWTFTPNATSANTVRTYTVEFGTSVRAARFGYGLVTAWGYTINRDETSVTGSLVGQKLTDGITLTANPTAVAAKPVLPTQAAVDTSAASLGSTRLTRCFELEFSYSDIYGPIWVVDSAQPSWVAHAETMPTAEFTLTVEADSTGMGLLTAARADSVRFLRVEAIGDAIGTTNYRFRHDAAIKVTGVGDYDERDGVTVIPFTCQVVYDPGWGKAQEFNLINELSAL
jgi:hypothetical protein